MGWIMRRVRWARPDKNVSPPPRPQSAEVQDPSRPPEKSVVQSSVERKESGSDERPWTEVERGKKKMWKKQTETRQSLERLQKGLEGNESRRQRE